MFQFIPNMFDGVEFRALCRPIKFFHTDPDNPFLYLCMGGIVMLKQEFTTSVLKSSYRNISRMIHLNRMHLSSISNPIAKGLNTYVNKVFLFFMGYCVCVD